MSLEGALKRLRQAAGTPGTPAKNVVFRRKPLPVKQRTPGTPGTPQKNKSENDGKFATARAAVIRLLRRSQDEAAVLPSCCHGCDALEIIPGVGAGCVQPLPGGPWREEWRRLPADLKRCWERQEAAPDRRTVRAKGTGCGRCGNATYTAVEDG